MSATAHLNMINLQVMAEEQMAVDRANGTYEANVASDPKYYLWHSEFQTLPMGMEGQPEAYAQLLRQNLPDVNTLRLPFNAFSFNEDGSLDPVYERFLAEAARQGFQIVMGYFDGDAQRLGENSSATLSEMRDGLTGSVHDRMMQSWEMMLDWLDGHPDVNSAIYALEAVNEPAAYGRAEALAGGSGEFVRLYGDHMAEFAALIQAHSDARIMVGGFQYSAQFEVLAETLSSDGLRSVLDQIRDAAGEDLVWSAHLYPDWAAAAGQDVEGMAAFLQNLFGALGDDDLIVTETNAEGDTVNDVETGAMSFWMARAYEAFADAGIGLGWFPGAETSGSSFVTINNGRYVNFQHTDSYAQGMNGFLLDEDDPDHAAGEEIVATLLAGNVYAEDGTRIAVDGLGYAAGHGGNDTMSGLTNAMNMLYGGRGDDVLIGTAGRDHLFGQADNDTIDGGAGDDVLSGGDGDDVIHGGLGNDVLTGGRGADSFVLMGGQDLLTDFRHDLGDQLTLGTRAWTALQIRAAGRYVDHDGDGVVDDLILDWTDGQAILMNHRRPDGIVQGTEAADSIAVGYQDIEGETFTRNGGRVQGLAGDDTITGSTAADWLDGGLGNDRILGGAAADTLRGADGDDTIDGGYGNDLIYGGTGHDSLMGAGDHDTVYGDAGNDEISGGAGNDELHGGDGNDVIDGGADNDTINGGRNDDNLIGMRGNDVLYGGDNNDTLDGGDNNDTLWGEGGRDTLYGGGGNDALYGGDGRDYLDGGSGQNQLDGGTGQDTLMSSMSGKNFNELTGGSGADEFIFTTFNASGNATAILNDFLIGADVISIGDMVGFDAIEANRLFGGYEKSGNDTVMRFGDDTYIFKGHDISDFL